jgi:hypothetical protein
LQSLAPTAEFVVWGAQEGEHSRAHGPDESQDLAELERMILAEARFLELLGERAADRELHGRRVAHGAGPRRDAGRRDGGGDRAEEGR